MRRRNDELVNYSVGDLASEIAEQDLEGISGGATPAIISAVTAVTAFTLSVNNRVTDSRNCGAFFTVSAECFGNGKAC